MGEWSVTEGKEAELQERVELAWSRNPRNRGLLARQWRFFWWCDEKQPQHCPIATLEKERSGSAGAQGPPLGSRAGLGGWTQGHADVPHANTLEIGACASACKEFICDASLQTPCRTTYCVGFCPLHWSFFFFFFIFKHKCVLNSP